MGDLNARGWKLREPFCNGDPYPRTPPPERIVRASDQQKEDSNLRQLGLGHFRGAQSGR